MRVLSNLWMQPRHMDRGGAGKGFGPWPGFLSPMLHASCHITSPVRASVALDASACRSGLSCVLVTSVASLSLQQKTLFLGGLNRAGLGQTAAGVGPRPCGGGLCITQAPRSPYKLCAYKLPA